MEEKIKLGYLDEDYTNRGLFYNQYCVKLIFNRL